MKRLLALLLGCMLLCSVATAEQAASPVGVWIENDGYGTLTIRADGTARMDYYDDTVTETTWGLTENGYRFGEGMWYNSPLELLDENTLSVSDGWMIFTREGFLPTTDEALLLGAEPVGEEGEPFLGAWALSLLIAEGEEIDPALLGVAMTMTFFDSGLVTTDDGLEPYTTTWSVSYGNVELEGDILVLDENDQLVFNQEDGAMIFTRIPVVEDEPIPEDEPNAEPVPVGEEGAAFLGAWTLVLIEAEGMQMDPALLGMHMTLTFSEDGTVLYDDTLEADTMPWSVENGAAIVDDLPLTINEEGQLIMDDGEATMIFTQGAAGPADELSEEDELIALLQLLAMMEGASDDSAAFDPLGTKFIMDQFTIDGITRPGSTLNAEYSVRFYEDGSADLTLGGIPLENAHYTITEEGVYSVNYCDTIYNCTPTDAGFDMDYFGTMTLHLVPEE